MQKIAKIVKIRGELTGFHLSVVVLFDEDIHEHQFVLLSLSLSLSLSSSSSSSPFSFSFLLLGCQNRVNKLTTRRNNIHPPHREREREIDGD
jgi:hypothetical protein